MTYLESLDVSVCFVLLHDHERNKLQSRSRLCCFLVCVSRHVVFWEHKMFYQLPHVPASLIPSIDLLPDLFPEESPTSLSNSPPSITDVPSHAYDKLPVPIIDVPTATAPTVDLAGSSDLMHFAFPHRVTTIPSHLRDFHCFSALASLQEPQTFHEASSNPLWKLAMKEELDALHKTRTWDLVDLPYGKSAIGCKWVYKIKTQSDGTVDRYKARLVAKGFT